MVAYGGMDGQQADARTHAGACGQYGSSGHSVGTGNEQSVTEIALVGKTVAGLDEAADFVGLTDSVRRFGLGNVFLADTDVQQFPFAYILFVFREEECQFRQLDAEGQVCLDNVLADVVGIVFAHQSRRHIDGYDRRL